MQLCFSLNSNCPHHFEQKELLKCCLLLLLSDAKKKCLISLMLNTSFMDMHKQDTVFYWFVLLIFLHIWWALSCLLFSGNILLDFFTSPSSFFLSLLFFHPSFYCHVFSCPPRDIKVFGQQVRLKLGQSSKLDWQNLKNVVSPSICAFYFKYLAHMLKKWVRYFLEPIRWRK